LSGALMSVAASRWVGGAAQTAGLVVSPREAHSAAGSGLQPAQGWAVAGGAVAARRARRRARRDIFTTIHFSKLKKKVLVVRLSDI